MRARVDYSQCMGDRNCNRVCPQVFAYDEQAFVSRVLADPVPKDFEGKVRQAADECPVKAIFLEE